MSINPWFPSTIYIFFQSLIFFEKYLDMMFNNTQHGKKDFPDYKKVILTWCDNVQWFPSKNKKKMGKKRLPWLQKCHFNIVGKCPFFQRG